VALTKTRARVSRGPKPGPPRPYLDEPLRADFDRWLEETAQRYSPPLAFREIRRGVQALSSLYVERRVGGDLSARAHRGAGKRAALATYFAPLHFLTAHHALNALAGESWTPPSRIWDLGCGTGALGAALARGFETVPEVIAIDRSGFALREARHTYRAFGIYARTRRGRLPAALPPAAAGELWSFGFVLNELEEDARATSLNSVSEALELGVRLFIVEPLAGPVTPWWSRWCEKLARFGVMEHLVKRAINRPEWIGRLDRASRLNHRIVGCRVLAGPSVPVPNSDSADA